MPADDLGIVGREALADQREIDAEVRDSEAKLARDQRRAEQRSVIERRSWSTT
jgi:hypothetical protein